ncbi:MAG TPA: hypothetical protein PK605_09620 [Ignavibacteria bacterium]|nr:hypothetical protein [Ignavibacteria bacterium]HRF64883.1 hypothetical protein [Ignavibacteria bacterium]HRJ04645.1 hypothetical protein [Ignavibacteria bacterium]
MKNILKNFRSLVFTVVFGSLVCGFLFEPALSHGIETKRGQPGYYEICDSCYIIYVWVLGTRWAQVYTTDGSMIDFYPDPEE